MLTGASQVAKELLETSISSGVTHAKYLSTLRPVTAQILEGTGFPTANAPKVADYVFSMFREINGAPALNLEFTAAIHRSGKLHYLDSTGMGLDLFGEAGKESPIGRTVEVVRLVGASTVAEIFGRDSQREFPGNEIVVLASFFGYVAPKSGAEFLEPMHVFYFVPKAGKVVQPARWWGYRVEQENPEFVELPTTFKPLLDQGEER